MMSRFLLKLALFITFMLTITCLAARAFGSTQALNPALRGFTEGCENQPQPCWYGIVPGITTMEELKKNLDAMGSNVHVLTIDDNLIISPISQPCNAHIAHHSSLVRVIQIRDCDQLTLGGLVNVIDEPELIGSTGGLFFMEGKLSATVQFKHTIGESCVSYTPYSLLSDIEMYSPINKPSNHFWKGFKPYWWYVSYFGIASCDVMRAPGW